MPVNFGHKQGEIPLPASLKTVPWLDRPGTDPAPAASLFRAEVLFCSLFQEGGSSKLQPGSREKRTNIYSAAHRDADADARIVHGSNLSWSAEWYRGSAKHDD